VAVGKYMKNPETTMNINKTMECKLVPANSLAVCFYCIITNGEEKKCKNVCNNANCKRPIAPNQFIPLHLHQECFLPYHELSRHWAIVSESEKMLRLCEPSGECIFSLKYDMDEKLPLAFKLLDKKGEIVNGLIPYSFNSGRWLLHSCKPGVEFIVFPPIDMNVGTFQKFLIASNYIS
jgi:hypothetical protein